MRNIVNLIVFLLVNTVAVFAQDPQQLFNEANELYKQKEYEQAAQMYEKIATLGYESAEVYYNLGNCYYKTNQTGLTILNYERAKKIEPDNDDIEFNLKLAGLRVNDRVEALPQMMLVTWFKNTLASQTANGWGKTALVLLWLAFIGGAVFLFSNKFLVKRISFLSASIFLIMSLLFLLIAFRQNTFEKTNNHGVVMVTNTYIKSAPESNAVDLFILREGVKAAILEKAGDWQKIKLADGKVGWIKRDDIEVI
jgi:tetratricopeptide (TPR) repeat protein